jgi:hypothetical protein
MNQPPKIYAQSDERAAAYWNGSLSRKEAQKVFDQYAAVINAQAEKQRMMDMMLTYLFEVKLGIPPEEFQAWFKVVEEEAKQRAAADKPAEFLQ